MGPLGRKDGDYDQFRPWFAIYKYNNLGNSYTGTTIVTNNYVLGEGKAPHQFLQSPWKPLGGCGQTGSASTPGFLDSRENRPSRISRLTDSKFTRAMRSWSTAQGNQGQIVIRYGGERSGKLTLWLRSGGTGDRNGQCVDVENAECEEGESGFGEHDGVECREKDEKITAPGLRFGR